MIKLKGGVGGIMARSAKRAKREVCSRCGQPLGELPWTKSGPNQRMYILTCENAGCPCYRNPLKTTTKEAE